MSANHTTTTTQALDHLICCEMIPANLRKAIKDMQGFTAQQFDHEIARALFSRLSTNIHLSPLIEADCAVIPTTISRFERHLVIAIAISMGANWKYINEDGIDVSDILEPGLREKVEQILRN